MRGFRQTRPFVSLLFVEANLNCKLSLACNVNRVEMKKRLEQETPKTTSCEEWRYAMTWKIWSFAPSLFVGGRSNGRMSCAPPKTTLLAREKSFVFVRLGSVKSPDVWSAVRVKTLFACVDVNGPQTNKTQNRHTMNPTSHHGAYRG